MPEQFLEILKKGQSKKNADKIKDAVIANPLRIRELMDCFLSDDLRICQNASWPVGLLGIEHGELFLPYFDKMISAIEKSQHDAVVRNTFRVWQFMDIPEDFEGPIYDLGFSFLQDMKAAIAIKVFAMTVLVNIASKYPDLTDELIPAIEEQFPHGSKGFQSRAKKELKRLHKIASQANA